jgi:ubiquinone/menaquinone biosynthesis C-methylase UbiE
VIASYDRVAGAYAEHLASELDGKPLDRQWLDQFAEATRGAGTVADVACGPGHITEYLRAQGMSVIGIDISPGMVRTAVARFPAIEFRVGDMTALDVASGSLAGVVAFYAIVHCSDAEVDSAFAEFRRVLRQGGLLLLAFHAGDETVHRDELFGHPVSLDFRFFPPDVIAARLTAAGFRLLERVEREPYEGAEYPSRRCYVLATPA